MTQRVGYAMTFLAAYIWSLASIFLVVDGQAVHHVVALIVTTAVAAGFAALGAALVWYGRRHPPTVRVKRNLLEWAGLCLICSCGAFWLLILSVWPSLDQEARDEPFKAFLGLAIFTTPPLALGIFLRRIGARRRRIQPL